MEFVEVDSVEEFNYKGKVYDIGVEVDHTYTINNYSVHNSAAGSLINYVLGLTDVDPLKHNLLFERFLDIEREDVVDIDTDFEPRIRDAVVDYMIKKYGNEYTSSIGTYGVLKPRSAILDVARTFGIPAQETMKVTKYLSGAMDDDITLEELEQKNYNLKKYLDKWENKGYNLRYYIRGVAGSIRQPSVHAAGVLVSSEKLSENVALIKAKKRPITAWQEGSLGRELSDLGYYKFDILGLNNLQVINDTVKLIKKHRDIEINWEDVDLNEEFVYKNVVQNKDHFGVFQMESNFVQKMIDNIKPENFDQLSAISALLRPGPLHMGMDKEFARRKNQIADDNGHVWSAEDIPEPIRDILKPTMGILTYQEQIMQIANRIGGFTIGETNQFRKNLMKVSKVSGADPEFKKKMDKYREKFVENASKPENLGSEKEAGELWELMESFAGYGFNLSHSVSYTYVSFREYWLKAHYDPEFNVALLNNTSLQKEKKGESVIATYLTEMMKKGYTIISPNVNLSERSFTLKSNSEIVWGLNWIKNLTDKSIFDILSDRELNGEFKNIDDFYERIGGTALNKRVIEALIWSGALDVFIDGEVFSTRWDVHNYIFGKLKKTSKFQPLTGGNDDLIEKEIEYLSISFEEINNFGKIRKTWEEQSGAEMDFLHLVEDEGQFNAIGIIDRIEEKKTKNGKDYRRITLRDETKILKMVYVWPWKCKGWDSLRKGMLIQASLTNDGTFIHLVGWTMITQSEKQKQIEEKEKQEKKQQETQEKQQQEQEYKKFLDAFKQIYNKWNKQFDVKREIDDISKQPILRISSKYDSSNIIVYHYSEEKGIPRKDVIKMKEYDAIYIISDLGEYLFDMHTFQSKMTKVKSQNRIKYPNIPGDIEKELPEEVIANKLS